MSTNKVRVAITTDELELALAALEECADDQGLTPVKTPVGVRMSASAVIRHALEVNNTRTSAIMTRMKRTGLITSVDKSAKVIIQSMSPTASSANLQGSVSAERVRAALTKLIAENERLKRRVSELEERVDALEMCSGGCSSRWKRPNGGHASSIRQIENR